MSSRKKKRLGKISELGGRISEGKVASSIQGYKEIARRKRVGDREIDRLLKRGNTIAHLETTKTCITKPKMEKYWDKYIKTRIATNASKLFVHSPCITKPALKFAQEKKIRIV